jgi:predicted esterase
MNLRVAKADGQVVQQRPQLRFVDLAIAVGVHTFEAGAQRILGHGRTVRRLFRAENLAAAALMVGLGACQEAQELPSAAASPAPPRAHPVLSVEASKGLPPLRSEWLVELADGHQTTVVTPPVGAVAPSRLILGAHGAGDRPDWACGGWRLSSQVTAFVACPQGRPMGGATYAWGSPQQLEERALVTVEAVKARYPEYLARAPYVFAGFSQGATYAEPLLRKHAALFPIAILAEGGYRIMTSPSFAAAYRAGGGRRVVLVCGNPNCFVTARGAKKVLEGAGLEALVVGDEAAGHNLNGRMQRALQAAWPRIVAPLPG